MSLLNCSRLCGGKNSKIHDFSKYFWNTHDNNVVCSGFVFVCVDSLRPSQQFFKSCQDGSSLVEPVLSRG